MDIHHIRYFLAVCDTLNFTRAAEQCNVTQPALSRAIQQLEAELGGLLFQRERNMTRITELGALMRPRLAVVMAEMSGVKRETKQFLTLEKATVTLGIMCTIGPGLLTGLLAQFRAQNPGVTLKLVEGVPKGLIERLESGDLDIALMTAGEEFPDRFDLIPLYRERFLIGFAAGHRFAAMKEVPVPAVDGENYLRRLNCEVRRRIRDHIDACGARINVAYESEREDWIQNMVAAGLGICFIPEFSATAAALQTRPVIEPEIWRDVCLVSMSGRRMSPAEQAFLKSARAHRWPTSRFGPQAAAA